jgi:hypothetical protein
LLLLRLVRQRRPAALIGFLWGYAEGTVFFLVPDIWITWLTLFAPRSGLLAWLASIAGSLAAVLTFHGLITGLGLDPLGWIGSLPGISESMIAAVESGLAVHGLPWTPWLIAGGVPLKVYAGVAFLQGMALGSVLLWTVFARVVRIAPTVLATLVVRRWAAGRIDRRPGLWTALLLGLWSLFYLAYFRAMS